MVVLTIGDSGSGSAGLGSVGGGTGAGVGPTVGSTTGSVTSGTG